MSKGRRVWFLQGFSDEVPVASQTMIFFFPLSAPEVPKKGDEVENWEVKGAIKQKIKWHSEKGEASIKSLLSSHEEEMGPSTLSKKQRDGEVTDEVKLELLLPTAESQKCENQAPCSRICAGWFRDKILRPHTKEKGFRKSHWEQAFCRTSNQISSVTFTWVP